MIQETQVPAGLVAFASQWYDGSDSMLYAIASTGNLTIGSVRPYHVLTDQEWHVYLFDALDLELAHLLRHMKRNGSNSFCDLKKAELFQSWAEKKADELREAYGLNDDEDDVNPGPPCPVCEHPTPVTGPCPTCDYKFN